MPERPASPKPRRSSAPPPPPRFESVPPPESWEPLPRSFFDASARTVAPALLGHWLVRRDADGVRGGVVVEAEAYLWNDPACHAFKGMTARNRSMWGPPGRAYVYLIYGFHFCFNAVCSPEGRGEAILIRALAPEFGVEEMLRRRPVADLRQLASGPGKICAALGIDRALDGADLCDANSPVFMASNPGRRRYRRAMGPVARTPRVGIHAAADALLRFFLAKSELVSQRGASGRRTARPTKLPR